MRKIQWKSLFNSVVILVILLICYLVYLPYGILKAFVDLETINEWLDTVGDRLETMRNKLRKTK